MFHLIAPLLAAVLGHYPEEPIFQALSGLLTYKIIPCLKVSGDGGGVDRVRKKEDRT